jgi:hypothetical protein
MSAKFKDRGGLKMTFQEFAHSKAEKLIKNPTQSTVVNVVNDIRNATVDGTPITDSQIQTVLRYLEAEIGNLKITCEAYDNKETLSLMSEIRKLIAQANAGK